MTRNQGWLVTGAVALGAWLLWQQQSQGGSAALPASQLPTQTPNPSQAGPGSALVIPIPAAPGQFAPGGRY